jgi:sigma-B regulation protein RsbU (phosphoserine phosphatase)
VTLENIELYHERLERQRINEEIAVSREIQRMLLPHEIPQGNNFEISAINLPSKEVGGDYYDFVTLDERRIGISIGDISGKGIPGAILMSNLQAAFRAAALSHLSSAEVMERVNNQIARSTSPEKFATFLYGILNTKKLQFSYTNAGHNYPIWRKKNGDTRYLLNTGLVVGVQKDFVYQENKIKLDRGDVLVFYTDGITEAFNAQHDEFSEKHLLSIISNSSFTSAEELRNDIYEEVVDFTKGVGQYDDITLIVLHVFG